MAVGGTQLEQQAQGMSTMAVGGTQLEQQAQGMSTMAVGGTQLEQQVVEEKYTTEPENGLAS